MKATLRRKFISWRNHLYHRRVVLGLGTSLNPQAEIDPEVEIGKDCIVLKARLTGRCRVKDRVLICDGASLHASNVNANCRIESGVRIAGSHLEVGVAIHQAADLCDVKIGKYTYIARETAINRVEIGRFCSIGPRCLMGTGEHPVTRISTSPVFYSSFDQAGGRFSKDSDSDFGFAERRMITVGHDVWIGAHVFVRDGIKIGNGAIVGAGAVVIRDVPAYEVVGGVPARKIRVRFPTEVVEQIESIAWWDWPDDILREAQSLISSEKIEALLAFAREHARRK